MRICTQRELLWWPASYTGAVVACMCMSGSGLVEEVALGQALCLSWHGQNQLHEIPCWILCKAALGKFLLTVWHTLITSWQLLCHTSSAGFTEGLAPKIPPECLTVPQFSFSCQGRLAKNGIYLALLCCQDFHNSCSTPLTCSNVSVEGRYHTTALQWQTDLRLLQPGIAWCTAQTACCQDLLQE